MNSEHPVESPDDVGSRIRRYRTERGMSLSQLAKDAGISKGYLWSLENEETSSRPSADTLYAVADALGVLMSDLHGRKLTLDTNDQPIPEGLRSFAEERGLLEADIRMLASVQFRRTPPTSPKRWEYIYNAIIHSRGLDSEE